VTHKSRFLAMNMFETFYSLSGERLVDIKMTKFYAEKIVPSARKI
jgi:hypothetical protein